MFWKIFLRLEDKQVFFRVFCCFASEAETVVGLASFLTDAAIAIAWHRIHSISWLKYNQTFYYVSPFPKKQTLVVVATENEI
jgi:hypothetical protein